MHKMAMVLAFFFVFLGTPTFAGGPPSKAPVASDKKTDNPADKKADKKSGKNESHSISTSPSYLGIDPIYTTILDQDTVAGTFMLGIGLDVPDPTLRGQIVQNMPMYRDLYVRTILAYTSVNIRSWRQPDVEDIAARLQAATDKKLKHKGVRVLLSQVATRINH